MIRPSMFIIGACFLISACSKPERAEASGKFEYLRQDGQQKIRVDLKGENIKFTDPNSEKSDLGGLTKDCSTDIVYCLNLAGYLVAFPKAAPSSDAWSAGGADFSVVGRLDRGETAVWLVKVSMKGDAYMFFSYSAPRGVESISLQLEGVGPDLAKTYLLAGEQGLLAAEH